MKRKVQSLFLTTDLPHRKEMADKAFACLWDAGAKYFDLNVQAVDICTPSSQFNPISASRGNLIVRGNCTGHRAMVNNIYRGLAECDPKAVLVYCEDHIFINSLPSLDILSIFFDSSMFGWLNLNTHVHEENLCNVPGFVEKPGRERKLAYVQSRKNWIKVDENYEVLIKGPEIEDEYLLNFPVAITTVQIFRSLLEHAMKIYKDIGIEIGFTRAWNDLRFCDEYKVGIVANALPISGNSIFSFQDLHNRALMSFRNNDPSMMHESVISHENLPDDDKLKRSFF